MKPVRRIFTRRPSLWERLGDLHPGLQACCLLVGLGALMAVAEPLAQGIEWLMSLAK